MGGLQGGEWNPRGRGTVSPAWVMQSPFPSVSLSCFFRYHPWDPGPGPGPPVGPAGKAPVPTSQHCSARGSGASASGQCHSSHPHPSLSTPWGFSSWRTETGNPTKKTKVSGYLWQERPERPALLRAKQECQSLGSSFMAPAPQCRPALASGQGPQAPCYRNCTAGCAAIKRERPRPLCCASWGGGDGGSASRPFSSQV